MASQLTPQEPPSTWSMKRFNPFKWVPTSIEKAQTSELRLLARISFFKPLLKSSEDTNLTTGAKIGLVDIGSGKLINTCVIDRIESSPLNKNLPVIQSNDKKVLVMTHGYGAGLGFYYRCFNGLSEILGMGWKIYALDWLGMANSSRPPFPFPRKHETLYDNVERVEDFFIDSLELWREKNGINEMTLLGHSLGGYLSTCYALKYPDRVGVPQKPEGMDKSGPSGRKIPDWVVNLWQKNITPMWVIRLAGPWGPSIAAKYTTRRFQYTDAQESKDFEEYFYHICAQKGSGEYALGTLLLPGAWAIKPLFNRLPSLNMPVHFMYGESDWMPISAAQQVSKSMKVPVRISSIIGAGHQIFMDNPEGFVKVVLDDLSDPLYSKPVQDSEHVQYT